MTPHEIIRQALEAALTVTELCKCQMVLLQDERRAMLVAALEALDWLVPAPKPLEASILEEAQRLVHGDRGADYGHPLDDFTRTADMMTGLFRHKLKPGEAFAPEDFAKVQILGKLSREENRPKRDNRTDGAGYFETIHMVHEERARRESGTAQDARTRLLVMAEAALKENTENQAQPPGTPLNNVAFLRMVNAVSEMLHA